MPYVYIYFCNSWSHWIQINSFSAWKDHIQPRARLNGSFCLAFLDIFPFISTFFNEILYFAITILLLDFSNFEIRGFIFLMFLFSNHLYYLTPSLMPPTEETLSKRRMNESVWGWWSGLAKSGWGRFSCQCPPLVINPGKTVLRVSGNNEALSQPECPSIKPSGTKIGQ